MTAPAGQIVVGDVVDAVTFAVEAGKVAEFVRATRVEDPVHTDADAARAAGFPAPRAPSGR